MYIFLSRRKFDKITRDLTLLSLKVKVLNTVKKEWKICTLE